MARTDIPQLIALTLSVASSSGCWFFSCPDTTTETPVAVEDWAVSLQTYAEWIELADSRAESGDTGLYGYVGTAWADRDAASRCRFACAVASDYVDTYAGTAYASAMTIESCSLEIPSEDGDGLLNCTATVTTSDVCIGGRRPLEWSGQRGELAQARDHLAGMAVMEQVSIVAFDELAAQLELRAAPPELVARCRAAAHDERRHVELLVALGVERPRARPEPAPAHADLLEVALHNAVEGCVAETWAALLARHQSEHAADPRTRAAFAQIALDEAGHAQLAWDLHAWLCAQLDASARGAVEAARTQALMGLASRAAEQSLAVPPAVRRALGLPAPARARQLAADFGLRLRAA